MVFRNKPVDAEETAKRVASGEQESAVGGWAGAGDPWSFGEPHSLYQQNWWALGV